MPSHRTLLVLAVCTLVAAASARSCSRDEQRKVLAYLQCNVKGCGPSGGTSDVGEVSRTERALYGSVEQVRGMRCSLPENFLESSGLNVNQGFFSSDFARGKMPFFVVDLAAMACSKTVWKAVLGSPALKLNERSHFFHFMYMNSDHDQCQWGRTALAYVEKARSLGYFQGILDGITVPRSPQRHAFDYRDVPYTRLLKIGDVTHAMAIFDLVRKYFKRGSYIEKQDLCQTGEDAIAACYDPKAQLMGRIRPQIGRDIRRVSEPALEQRYKQLKKEKKKLEGEIESKSGGLLGSLFTPDEVHELEEVVAELTKLKERRTAMREEVAQLEARLDEVNSFLRLWEKMGCSVFRHPASCNMP